MRPPNKLWIHKDNGRWKLWSPVKPDQLRGNPEFKKTVDFVAKLNSQEKQHAPS